MTVVTRFVCQSVEKQGYSTPAGAKIAGVKVVLAPVFAPNDTRCDHKKFWDATPTGQLWMQIQNPAAFDAFVPGEEYYLTFAPAKGGEI